jgi:hypothetical protein
VSEILQQAGFDTTDGEEFKRGAAALMAAQMVAVSAGLAAEAGPGPGVTADGQQVGRNDPCPCGSGKKYKKCCLPRQQEAAAARARAQGKAAEDAGKPATDAGKSGADADSPAADAGKSAGGAGQPGFGGVRPAMLPRMGLEAMQEDTQTLGRLLQSDPELRKRRFHPARMATFLEPHSAHVPADLAERDRWIARRAHDFVAAEHQRAGEGEEAETIQVLKGLKEALLDAARRYRDDDARLRSLALGLLYHSSWSPELEEPHPLETMLFRLTLQETAVEQQTRASLLSSLGEDPDALARRLAAGDPEAAEAWQASFDELPEEKRVELLRAAERYHDEVVQAVTEGRFAVPLPLVSVLPLVIRTVSVIRDAADDNEARQAAQELAVQQAREGLSEADRALYLELCDQWLASDEAAEADDEDEDEINRVRYVRGLAAVGSSSVEPVLLLAFLDHHRVTPIPGEPNPDPAGGQEIDSPAFLERYGAFFAEQGRQELALRTWRLCRFGGDIPASVQKRIDAAEKEIAARN